VPPIDDVVDATDRSDNALVERVRREDSSAYAELWLRHRRAAGNAARAFTTLDPDDVVSEAFARVLTAIRNGGGPTMGFRAYLLTAVRSVARDWGTVDARDEAFDPTDEKAAVRMLVDEDASVQLSSGPTYEVFRSLPPRWREALWYSEVERLRPREFAPMLGVAPNAASALVNRARRGFRDAWMSSQLTSARSEDCVEVIRLLRSERITSDAARRVRAHTDECDGCAIAWSEVSGGSARLAKVLVPLVLGVAAASTATAWARGGAVARVAAGAGRGRRRARGLSRRAGVSIAVAVTTVAVATAAVATVAVVADPTEARPVAAESRPTASSSTGADAAPPAAPTPSASASTPPDVPPADEGDRDTAPTDRAPAPRLSAPVAPDPVVPTPSATIPVSVPTPRPSATTRAPSTPAASLPVLSVQVDGSGAEGLYPVLSGSGARAGARIEVSDASGRVVTTTTADSRGRWRADTLDAADCAVTDAEILGPGAHTLTVRQSVGERRSAPSDPLDIDIAEPPAFASPMEGSIVTADGFELRVTGIPDAAVQRIKVPDADPCRPDPMTLDADGAFSAVFRVSDEGPFALGIRYFDPATGRRGPAVFVHLTPSPTSR
jgi:RNA polymerase sigma factor (sigma-70 family)